MTSLFPSPDWPEVILESIYALYPNRQDRKTSLKRIAEALTRICDGEIDGNPRMATEAIEWLRNRTNDARVAMNGKEKKWIPHSATWFNQRRYLRPKVVFGDSLPEDLEACINILALYPKMPSQAVIRGNVESFILAITAISKALSIINPDHLLAYDELSRRVRLYAIAVQQWPQDQLQYVPNPKRFFDERRWEQDEALWKRNILASPAWEAEREQIFRILESGENRD